MVAGIVRRDLVFAPRWDLASVLGAVFMCYTLVAYPLIGMFGGHPLRTLPVFGLAPCPTVIFFFGLLLWARPPMPKYVLLLPLAWALNAAPSNLAMGHVADFVLILAGVITAGLIIWRDRTSSWQTAAGPEGQRLLFIDNLRIVLICGVLVVHLAVPIRSGKTVGLSSAGGFSRYGGFLHAIGMRGFVSILLDAPEYSIGDCISNLRMRDVKFSCRWLGDEYMGVNLLQEIPELSVPVVFFAGSYDYATPFVLVEEFYDSLQAPYKKLIWFEHLAHNPDIEEPDKFQRALIALGDEFCSEKHPQDALVAKLKKEQS